MALKKDFTKIQDGFDGTLVAKDVYWRVCYIQGDKTLIKYRIEGKVGSAFIHGNEYSFVPSMGDKNFIKQAYEHAKGLPEFSDSTDC